MEDPSAQPPAATSFLVRRRALVILCLLQSLVIAVLTIWPSPNYPSSASPRRAGYSFTNREPFFVGNPGPWGELEFARVNIEPPDAFLPPPDREFEPTRWFFEGQSQAQVQARFDRCKLSEPQRLALANPAVWMGETNGVTLTPGADVILGLAPEARAEIYRELARCARNEFQYWPYTYRDSNVEEWFSHSGLSVATVNSLKKLVYRRGAAWCFSDLPELHARIANLAERRRLLKTLFRDSALLMKVRMRPQTDVEQLMQYWRRGGLAKDFRPLLESLTKVEGSIALDVAHLVPPFARERLNTYPSPAAPGKALPDCFWTAFNFFRDPPDDRYYDPKIWQGELEESYAIADAPTYGDLVFLLKPDGTPLHAAVYIADNVVFTKNGGHYRQPWVLTKLDDMRAHYEEEQGIRVVYFRRR